MGVPEALVLVQNEVTVDEKHDHWRDILGVQYHFPNQYLSKVQEGTRFIYYRGSRRLDGKRGTPEYFGSGRIGKVWRDTSVPEAAPRRTWQYFCEVDDYIPFVNPVPAKQAGKPTVETIAQNLWSVGVRSLSAHQFAKVLLLSGGAAPTPVLGGPQPPPSVPPQLPMVAAPNAKLISATSLAEVFAVPLAKSGNGSSHGSQFPSAKRAKEIGDAAEKLWFQHLQQEGKKNLKWCAQEGATPGWDMECDGHDGKLTAYEVKGTTRAAFTSIAITAQEWRKAEQLGSQFCLVLVTRCSTAKPMFREVWNPCEVLKDAGVLAEPSAWTLRFPPTQ